MKDNINILQSYSSAYRDLVNDRNLSARIPIKDALRLNKDKDWSFICTSMDIVDDATLALDSFLKFGLDGPTKYDDIGEKYLRLYGILSATYIQQQAILTLYKLSNIQHPKEANEKIQNLKIREIRHKIASHPCDYINIRQKDKLESFIPVRIYLSGYNIKYLNNDTLELETVLLKDCLEEHIKLMIDLLDQIIEKSIRTVFRGKSNKIAEFDKRLEELRIERGGGSVIKIADGETTIVILGVNSN
jgi:hypothetical protein